MIAIFIIFFIVISGFGFAVWFGNSVVSKMQDENAQVNWRLIALPLLFGGNQELEQKAQALGLSETVKNARAVFSVLAIAFLLGFIFVMVQVSDEFKNACSRGDRSAHCQ